MSSLRTVEEIPKTVSPDQYDKLMRRIWEMEVKLKALDRATLDTVSLDMLFDKQLRIEQELTYWRRSMPKILAGLVRLMRREEKKPRIVEEVCAP